MIFSSKNLKSISAIKSKFCRTVLHFSVVMFNDILVLWDEGLLVIYYDILLVLKCSMVQNYNVEK